jgi:SAM-dependent methyltransferase
MSYFKELYKNYKFYKQCKKAKLWNNKVSSSTYLKYPPQCTFKGDKVLNFGSGACIYKAPNVVNLDCTPGECVTVVDASEIRLPFADNTFDFIIANHVMEHLPQWFETMKEFARVCKVGGKIEIWIPPISSDSAFGYRDHLNRIGADSFAGCRSVSRPGSNLLAAKEFESIGEFGKLVLTGYTARPIVTWWTTFAPQALLQWMTTHLRNVISEEGYFFVKGE